MKSRRAVALCLSPLVPLLAPALATPAAQKKALTTDDYSSWRNTGDAAISGDGQWAAYTVRHMHTRPGDSKPVLMLRNLESDQDVEIPNAHDGVFSPDSRWIVYQVDSAPAPKQRRGDDTTAADTGLQTDKRP